MCLPVLGHTASVLIYALRALENSLMFHTFSWLFSFGLLHIQVTHILLRDEMFLYTVAFLFQVRPSGFTLFYICMDHSFITFFKLAPNDFFNFFIYDVTVGSTCQARLVLFSFIVDPSGNVCLFYLQQRF
jgi:hypothetical protein